MARKNILTSNPPYAVEQALRRLGMNLRTARLRRNLTIDQVAAKIGTGRRAVIGAEKGQSSSSAAVYAALLWAYDLLDPMETLADPTTDTEGQALAGRRERARAEKPTEPDNDF
jgi:transcriptional regulator with XRE-family HTH domain